MNKLYIHPLYIFLAFSSIMTGLFFEFILMSSIIAIHELGHLLVSKIYKWRIDKIYLYPFGGQIKYDEYINKPIKEEFYILIAGPIFQIIYYFIFCILIKFNIIRLNTFNIITNYHYSLLLFNLLPIIPLDGSKLFNLFLSKLMSFKLSHKYTIYISYIFLLLLLIGLRIVSLNVNLYLLVVILFYKILEEQKKHLILFNKFLLERYLYYFDFKKTKILKDKNLDNLMRDKRHYAYINKKYISEKELLKGRFKP